jgi:hypothetical protein
MHLFCRQIKRQENTNYNNSVREIYCNLRYKVNIVICNSEVEIT